MTLTLRTDSSHPGGGFALLEGAGLAGVTAISFENGFSGQFLGENGKWGRNAFAFPVQEAPGGALRLGPAIVDRVPTELQVELRDSQGRSLGKVFWADVIPSRTTLAGSGLQVPRVEHEPLPEPDAKGQRDRAAAEQAAAEAGAQAASAARDTERRRAAEKVEAERAAVLATAGLATTPPAGASAGPNRKQRSRWPLIAAVVLLPLVAIAVLLAVKPSLLDSLRQPKTPAGEERAAATPAPAAPPPAPQPEISPTPTPVPAPPAPKPAMAKPQVDCGTFTSRVADLQGRSDADKVALGEEALHAGCGSEAFQAFDSSDAQSSEAASWNLARFYDPNETDPVYRHAASVHPDYAAAYYKKWRDRSPRQAQALAKICEADQGGGASLRQSCAR